MSGWMIFALVLVVFFLIGQVHVGVDARYGEDGLLVKVRLGMIRLKVFPLPAKAANKKAKKKYSAKDGSVKETIRDATTTVSPAGSPAPKKRSSQQQEQPKLQKKVSLQDREPTEQNGEGQDKKAGKKMSPDQILELAREFVPLALEAVGAFWNDLVMDELEITVIVGSSDPADTAMLYGKINAAMGAIWESLSKAFHVKNGRAHVGIDFESENTTLYAYAALSIKIGQILHLALYFGIKALRKFMKLKKQQKVKEQARKAV